MGFKEIEEKAVHSCDTCEFNFGDICAGHGKRLDNNEDTYGMAINDALKMFEKGCDDWGLSLLAFKCFCKEHNVEFT